MMNKAKKGFTLAELLIVVAIIAVLVGISIPIFTSQLEKSREATDLANVRAAYAEILAAVMTEDTSAKHDGIAIYQDGIYFIDVKLNQFQKDWQSQTVIEIGGINSLKDKDTQWFGSPLTKGNAPCTLIYEEGKICIYWAGKTVDYPSIVSISLDGIFNAKNNPVINSSNVNHDKIKGIVLAANNLSIDFKNDIKSWAAVSDYDAPNAHYSYIFSSVDINTKADEEKVPALMVDQNGNYLVGYATVRKAPDGNYKVMTYDSNGSYAFTYTNGKGTKNSNYECDTLLTDSTQYSSLVAAEKAFKTLTDEYNNSNS